MSGAFCISHRVMVRTIWREIYSRNVPGWLKQWKGISDQLIKPMWRSQSWEARSEENIQALCPKAVTQDSPARQVWTCLWLTAAAPSKDGREGIRRDTDAPGGFEFKRKVLSSPFWVKLLFNQPHSFNTYCILNYPSEQTNQQVVPIWSTVFCVFWMNLYTNQGRYPKSILSSSLEPFVGALFNLQAVSQNHCY